MITLGSTVRRLREGSGLTQAELAEAVGISKSHISRIESDDREPSLSVLRKLADALSVWPGLLVTAFLQVEMPDGFRDEFSDFVVRVDESRSSDQLFLPLEG